MAYKHYVKNDFSNFKPAHNDPALEYKVAESQIVFLQIEVIG